MEEQATRPLNLTVKEDAVQYMESSTSVSDWNDKREQVLNELMEIGESYNYSFTNQITKENYNGSLPFPQWFTVKIDHSGLCNKLMKKIKNARRRV